MDSPRQFSSLPDDLKSVEVGPVGPGSLDVLLQRGRAAFALEGHPTVCQSDRYRFGLPLEVEPGRDRYVGQQCSGNPEALLKIREASTVGRATSRPLVGRPADIAR